jgi:hypothetical protein
MRTVGLFVKHDPQRFVVGAIGNQIRVLIQRMKLLGYKPWKILLSPGLAYALRLDSGDSPDYVRHDLGSRFMGLEIKIDPSVQEPIIMVKPEMRETPLDLGHSTPEEMVWRKKRDLSRL